jgi:hypothetical protein
MGTPVMWDLTTLHNTMTLAQPFTAQPHRSRYTELSSYLRTFFILFFITKYNSKSSSKLILSSATFTYKACLHIAYYPLKTLMQHFLNKLISIITKFVARLKAQKKLDKERS